MSKTIEDTGDGGLTKTLFVRGVDSAQIALLYALQLGVADSESLETALDARGAFDLLSAMMAALEPSQFVGDALAATRDDIEVAMTALYDKHPGIKPLNRVTQQAANIKADEVKHA